MINPSLDPQDTARLNDELERSESLVWAGKPLRRVVFHPSDWYLIPFSILWGGFSVFWEHGVLKLPYSGFMVLWGVPFVVMGQYFIWGRFLYDAWQKQRMIYALTSQRVIILQTGPRYKLRTGSLEDLGSRSLTVRSDGVGTIDFTGNAAPNPFSNGNRRNQSWSELSRFAFVDIEDARAVDRLIGGERTKLRLQSDIGVRA